MNEHARILTEEITDLLGDALALAENADRGDFDLPPVQRLLDGLRQRIQFLDCRHHVSHRTYYGWLALDDTRAVVSYKCGNCGEHTTSVMPMESAKQLTFRPKP